MHPKTWKILISSMCEMWRAYTKYLLCRIRAHKENRGYYRKYRKSGSRLCTSTTLRFSNLRNSSDELNRYVTISDRWDVVRVFEHPTVRVELSRIILFQDVIYQYSLEFVTPIIGDN